MAVQVLGKVAYFNKGAYNSQTNYEINDVVSYNGSSYVSLNDNNQGNLPTNTNYWSVVAEKGDKGDTGKPFVIEKTYSTIESMVADYDNMNVNDYVMIQGSIEEQENATLWTKREVEVSPYKWAYLADFSGASGITGATPNIHIGNVTEGNEPSVTRRSGSSNENPILDFVLKTGAKGDTGATGNGISSIEKTSTSGLVDTYTITFTNGTSTTIEVTNGRGIVSIAKTSSVDYVDTYTITYNDGTTSTFEVTNSEVTEEEFDDVVDELNYLYDDLPKVEGEGTNLTLNNTRKGKMSNVLRGNTSQYTTTGKNLYDVYDIYLRSDNFSEDEDDFTTYQQTGSTSSPIYRADYKNVSNKLQTSSDYWALIEIKEVSYTGTAPTMAFFTNINVGDYGQFATNVSYNFDQLSNGQKIKAKVTTRDDFSDCTCLARKIITYKAGTTSAKLVYRISILAEEPDVSTFEYEPFTNNEPSPNPDYPQDVEVVSGNNEITITNSDNSESQTYPINLGTMELCKIGDYQDYIAKSTGRNLFNGTLYNTQVGSNGGITSSTTRVANVNLGGTSTTYLKAGTYTLSIPDLDYCTVLTKNGDTIIDNWATSWQTLPFTFTMTQDAYLLFTGRKTSNTNITSGDYKPMLNEGAIALPYEPFEKGKWYKHSEIGKYTFTGNESFTLSQTANVFYLNDAYDNCLINNDNVPFCNMLSGTTPKANAGNMDNASNNTIAIDSGTNKRFYFKTNDYSDVSQLATGLIGKYVYWILATPTVTEITDQTLIAQLNAFEKALSYNGETNIITEGNLPIILEASAFMSLKYLFGNLETRVAELETSEPSEL